MLGTGDWIIGVWELAGEMLLKMILGVLIDPEILFFVLGIKINNETPLAQINE